MLNLANSKLHFEVIDYNAWKWSVKFVALWTPIMLAISRSEEKILKFILYMVVTDIVANYWLIWVTNNCHLWSNIILEVHH